MSAMQRDSGTYCDEPDDTEEYRAWLAAFDLTARRSDIDELLAGNAFMAELQSRIVPLIVEYDDFWTRYFYRLHQLQSKHAQRAQVVQLALQVQEETVAWDDGEDGDTREAAEEASQPEEAVLGDAHQPEQVDVDNNNQEAAAVEAAAYGMLEMVGHEDGRNLFNSCHCGYRGRGCIPTCYRRWDTAAVRRHLPQGCNRQRRERRPLVRGDQPVQEAGTRCAACHILAGHACCCCCCCEILFTRVCVGPQPFADDAPGDAALTGSDIDLGSVDAGAEDESDLDEDWGLE